MRLLIFLTFLCLANAYSYTRFFATISPESNSERNVSSTTDNYYSSKRDVSSTTDSYYGNKRDFSSTTDSYYGNKRYVSSTTDSYYDNKRDVSSTTDSYYGNKRDVSSTTDSYYGNKRDVSSTTDSYYGNKRDVSSTTDSFYGNKRDISSTTDGYYGNRRGVSSTADSYYGNKRDVSSTTDSYYGNKRDVSSTTDSYYSNKRDVSSTTDGYYGNRRDVSSTTDSYYGNKRDVSSTTNSYYGIKTYVSSTTDSYYGNKRDMSSTTDSYYGNKRDMSSTTDSYYGNKRDVSSTTDIYYRTKRYVSSTTENNYSGNRDKSRFSSSWTDLDKRPLPSWFDKAKIGIFLHWGLYSVPSYATEWFWHKWTGGDRQVRNFIKANYPQGFTYQEFAPMFKAELFNPNAWAELFAEAGAKYVVMTSKHHDGFSLFPSKRSFGWNSVEVGPKKDLVGELASAVKNKDLKFGIFYSLYEWYNPMYVEDKNNGFYTRTYVETKVVPEMKQLVNDYKPSMIWVTGDWEAPASYWNASNFLSWVYNESPVKDEVVVNDQWGMNMAGKHGDVYTNDLRNDPGRFSHKWEWAFKMDEQCWGYRRNMQLNDILTIEELLYKVVSAVSNGGNVLINVGPTKEGTIDLIFQERLLALGSWLSINGEAIYGSSPWSSQKDSFNSDTWYTCVKENNNVAYRTTTPNYNEGVRAIYAIILKWPENDVLIIKDVASLYSKYRGYRIEILGNEGQYLPFYVFSDEVKIALPQRSSLKSQHAWTLRFTEN